MASTSPPQPDRATAGPPPQTEAVASPTLDAMPLTEAGPGRWTRLLRIRELGIFVTAVGIFTVLAIVRPNTFLTEFNLVGLVRSFALVGIVAVGMTFLFVSGEIDLSVGSGYAFLSVVMAALMVRQGWAWPIAAAATLLLGAAVGFFNGAVTTFFHIPSFIVTLGMLSVLRGAALTVSGGTAIAGVDAPALSRIASADLFGIVPAQIVWFLATVVIGGWVLAKSRFGYHAYAVGDNPRAAANAGIDVRRTKIACFVLTGVLVGLIGVITTGWLRNGNPITGQSFELNVIAAVVIGGTNLFGGSGSILGTFLGAAIAALIQNGIILLGADIQTVPIAQGAVIILAVLLDVTIRRRQGL